MLYRNGVKILVLICVLAVLTIPPALAQDDDHCESSSDYQMRGWTHLQAGENSLAVEAFNCAIQLGFQDAGSFYGRGAGLVYIGQFEAAITDLEHAYELVPTYLDIQYYLGKAYNGLQEYGVAIQYFSTVIKQAPNHLYAYIDRGITYVNMGDRDAAIADLNHAVEIAPEVEEVYLQRGWAYAMFQEYDLAVSDFNHLLELKPDYTSYTLSFTYGYWTVSEYLEAKAVLDSVHDGLEADPNDVRLLTKRGIAYVMLGNFEAAQQDLDRVINLGSEDAKAYYYRGFILGWYQDLEAAFADYSRAIELSSNYADAYLGRGNIATRSEDYEAAVIDLQRGIELTAEPSPWPYLTLANSLSTLGEEADAGSNFMHYIRLIRYNTFNRVLAVDDSISVLLARSTVYHIRFTAEAGQHLKFSAYAAFDNLPLDPLIVLLGPDGTPLIGNDDQSRGETLNALINDFEVPETGEYTLLVTRGGGLSDGTVVVSIQTAR